MDAVYPYVAALVPTIVVAAFFYRIMKHIVEGDRRERMAQRRFEKEQDARHDLARNADGNPGAKSGDERP